MSRKPMGSAKGTVRTRWWPVVLSGIVGMTLGVLLDIEALPRSTTTSETPTVLPKPGPQPRLVRDQAVGLVKPLLLCDAPPSSDTDLVRIQDTVASYVNRLRQAHQLKAMSVHVRDLDHGRWFELGGDEAYRPASLLKVPLLMAWLRQADGHPEVLERRLTWRSPGGDLREDPNGPGGLQEGQSYTVRDLLDRLATWSRNDARSLLASNLPAGEPNAVCARLGMTCPFEGPGTLRVGEVAQWLRVLYNASWLSPELSSLALELLSHAAFHDGLVAKLPAGTKVAHKFGIRVIPPEEPEAADAREQLHDCGIVFAPGRPYLLCVMAKGPDRNKIATAIQDVSKLVWEAWQPH